MAQEKEIKIQLKIPLKSFVEKIESKGFKLVRTLNQIDIYFDTKDWFLYENIAALRLRQVDGKSESFSFKKVFYLPKIKDYYVEEIEVKYPFKDLSKLEEIFEKIRVPFNKIIFKNELTLTKYLCKYGYFDDQKMPKKRMVYVNGEDEIVIDDVDKVGVIVELECQKNNPLHVVVTFLKDKDWERSMEGTGYIWLKNVKGLTSHIKNLKRFKKEPGWNVWSNERSLYSSLIT